jgi:hypothetical protein
MSRDLPAHPNLEHLKNQAKDLLPQLQARNPALKLADAQHAIAREYGFATWPVLKAHVDSLAALPRSAFVGTWTANIAKSKRHPANLFQRATLQFAVAGNTVTIAHAGISESGREERGTNTIEVDGKEYPLGTHVTVARWSSPHLLEVVDKKDGQAVGRGTYEVSPDGKTMTVTSASGEQVLVFDRT